jgi:hypothetical protein
VHAGNVNGIDPFSTLGSCGASRGESQEVVVDQVGEFSWLLVEDGAAGVPYLAFQRFFGCGCVGLQRVVIADQIGRGKANICLVVETIVGNAVGDSLSVHVIMRDVDVDGARVNGVGSVGVEDLDSGGLLQVLGERHSRLGLRPATSSHHEGVLEAVQKRAADLFVFSRQTGRSLHVLHFVESRLEVVHVRRNLFDSQHRKQLGLSLLVAELLRFESLPAQLLQLEPSVGANREFFGSSRGDVGGVGANLFLLGLGVESVGDCGDDLGARLDWGSSDGVDFGLDFRFGVGHHALLALEGFAPLGDALFGGGLARRNRFGFLGVVDAVSASESRGLRFGEAHHGDELFGGVEIVFRHLEREAVRGGEESGGGVTHLSQLEQLLQSRNFRSQLPDGLLLGVLINDWNRDDQLGTLPEPQSVHSLRVAFTRRRNSCNNSHRLARRWVCSLTRDHHGLGAASERVPQQPCQHRVPERDEPPPYPLGALGRVFGWNRERRRLIFTPSSLHTQGRDDVAQGHQALVDVGALAEAGSGAGAVSGALAPRQVHQSQFGVVELDDENRVAAAGPGVARGGGDAAVRVAPAQQTQETDRIRR